MTNTQADLTERARALWKEIVRANGNDAIVRVIAAALQSEREAAAAEAVAQYQQKLMYLADAIKTLDKALATLPVPDVASPPASKDDLEGDVKHGNAEYFRAALAHAAAEARRAAIEECAQLADPLRSRGLPEDVRRLSEAIRALASPAPQEETR